MNLHIYDLPCDGFAVTDIPLTSSLCGGRFKCYFCFENGSSFHESRDSDI